MRQYLYRNGDQCHWNTGGWIVCKEEAKAYTAYYNPYKTSGVVAKNVTFASDHVDLSGSVKADVAGPYNYYNEKIYIRGGGIVNTNIGTVKPLPISIQKYTSLHVIGADSKINYNIRVGTVNDVGTTTATATILQAGSVEKAEFSLGDYNPYIVIGKTLDYGYYGDSSGSEGIQAGNFIKENPGNLDDSFTAEISEIYLA